MTRLVFRIKFDDKEKLVPIMKKFGKKSFTKHTVSEKCKGVVIAPGDLLRWDRSQYIFKIGETVVDGKYPHKVALWRLSDRVIKRLKQKPRGKKE